MSRRVPFAAAAGQFVARRVDRSVLTLILELRLRRGEREGKVDGLLDVHRVLLEAIDNLNLLLAVEQPDLHIDPRRVQAAHPILQLLSPRRFQRGGLGRGLRRAYRQVRGRQMLGDVNQAAIVAARHVHVLAEQVRAS